MDSQTPLLTRYQGFYLHDGQRVRWEASASAPILEVRALQHGKPKKRPDCRLLPAPQHWVTTFHDSAGMQIGHLLICDAALGDEAGSIFWGVLSNDLIRRHAIEIEEGSYRRTARYGGQFLELRGLAPDVQYRSLCALTDSDPWL